MEQVSQSWLIRPAAYNAISSQIMILAYPASSHKAISDEPQPLNCIAKPPTLTEGGTLVLLACGRSSPEVVLSEVLELSSTNLIAQYAVGEHVRAMRTVVPTSDTLFEMIVKHMRQLQLSGLNLARTLLDTPEQNSTDATTLSDVDNADL